ncbi:Rieske 2Fe-2S domain-containing protein [Bradyrhizobium archetypum]|uniref:Rieske (2Fe-2S) protein n=1 Tax=Bradyrhizobium archetypum TaxID=2721160 RepID=A0A7Y4M0I4_9BRAD|nr:Rieske (2Fe-2S) protein [Bradyrhizobium archetypum]
MRIRTIGMLSPSRVRSGRRTVFAPSSRERTVVRLIQGDLFALEHRCVYRQVPLSKGLVRKRLHCCYHGSTRRSWRTKANPNSANHLRRAGLSSLMI